MIRPHMVIEDFIEKIFYRLILKKKNIFFFVESQDDDEARAFRSQFDGK